MSAQLYGFYCQKFNNDIELAVLYTYMKDALVDDEEIGLKLFFKDLTILYGTEQYGEWISFKLKHDGYINQSLDQLSLQDAVKKGIKIIFTEL